MNDADKCALWRTLDQRIDYWPLDPGREEHRTAVHEAGHAVVGLSLGRPVDTVSIFPSHRAGTAGRVRVRKYNTEMLSKEHQYAWILTRMAGYVASRRFCPQDRSQTLAAASSDFQSVWGYLSKWHGPEDNARRLFRVAFRCSSKCILSSWASILTVAHALVAPRETGRWIKQGRLTGEQVTACMQWVDGHHPERVLLRIEQAKRRHEAVAMAWREASEMRHRLLQPALDEAAARSRNGHVSERTAIRIMREFRDEEHPELVALEKRAQELGQLAYGRAGREE